MFKSRWTYVIDLCSFKIINIPKKYWPLFITQKIKKKKIITFKTTYKLVNYIKMFGKLFGKKKKVDPEE